MLRKLLFACAILCAPIVARAQPVDARNPVFPMAGIVVNPNGLPGCDNLGPGTINVCSQSGVGGTIAINGTPLSGGASIPTASLLGGTGTAFSGVTLGTNLSITDGTLNATGGGTPGGNTGQVQFNNSGVFGGLPVGLTGNSTIVQTTSGGLLTPSLLPAATTGTIGGVIPDGTTISINGSGVISSIGGAATSVVVGTTTVGGGSAGSFLQNNSGTLGNVAPTGSGSVVLSTSPTLVTPALGTPSAIVLTNATGLPIAGMTGLGTGVASALGSAVTGSGGLVGATSPTLVTPALGTPSAAVLTHGTGLPISTGVSGLGTGVGTALGNAMTGSGSLVGATSPTIASPTMTGTTTTAGITDSGGISTVGLNKWGPQFITAWNSNGAPSAGGSGYAVGDLITLSDGTIVAVGTVSGGVVTGYFVSTPSTVSSLPAQPLSQASTTGSGSGATFNINYVPTSWGNVFEPSGGGNGGAMTAMGLGSYYGAKGHGIGNTFYGVGTGGGSFSYNAAVSEGLGGCTGITTATELTGNGFQALGCDVTGNWITATGTGAAEHEVDSGSSDYYGTDSGKYALHNTQVNGSGVSTFKFVQNASNLVATGDTAFEGGEISQGTNGPNVTGAANNGSGLIRLTLSTTTGMTNGDAVYVNSVAGTTEANTNGTPWYVTVIDGTHIDLQGSTFTHAYVASSGKVLDFPASFINLAITNAANNGSGLIRVSVANTFNIPAGTTANVHIAGVTGTTEANGTWTITNPWGPSCVSGCYVDLVGSTFTNAYISGGQMTLLIGPSESIAEGAGALGGTGLTGSLVNVTALGPQNSSSATMMGMVTSVGARVGQAVLGNGGTNFGVFIGGVDNTTDVVSNTVQDAVGLGRNMRLCNECILFGTNVGRAFTSSANNDDISGYSAAFAMVAPVNVTAHGSKVGSTTCISPSNVLLLGTNFHTDCTTANESGAIHIGAGNTDIITATGTTVPGTSVTTISGALVAKAVTLITGVTPAVVGGGFGTSAIVSAGTSAGYFQVNVGTGGTASSGTVNLGTVMGHGYSCAATDITNPATAVTIATPASTSTILLTNYSRTTGVLAAWVASDVIQVSCVGG